MSFVCDLCGRSFKTKHALDVHKGMYHKKKDAPNPVDPAPKVLVENGESYQMVRGVDDETMLKCFQLLEDGHSPVEIMVLNKISPGVMKNILELYRELTVLYRPEKGIAEAIYHVANSFGEEIRNGCEKFNEERGICEEFTATDVDEDFRKAYPTLFKGSGGKMHLAVGNHPWVCVLCPYRRSRS